MPTMTASETSTKLLTTLKTFFNEEFRNDPDGIAEWLECEGWNVEEFLELCKQ